MILEKWQTFPILVSERLRLGKITEGHFDALFNIRHNKEVTEFIERSTEKDREGLKEFISDRNKDFRNKKIIYWGIFEKAFSQLIGTICLWNFNVDRTIAEIGYELHPDHHGKGYMSEAMFTVLDFAFNELCIDRVEAFTHKDNSRSIKLLLKFDFKFDDERKDFTNANNIIYIKHAAC